MADTNPLQAEALKRNQRAATCSDSRVRTNVSPLQKESTERDFLFRMVLSGCALPWSLRALCIVPMHHVLKTPFFFPDQGS